jgi:glutamate N-acetyltransferase/amino-acid N-acetyltransferase
VLTTDAVVDAETATAVLREATDKTLGRLDVDGCTSTNDTVILLASGASGQTADPAELRTVVHAACLRLAKLLQDDAEGVTKRATIEVTGAASAADALLAARTVARDSLVKTALFGSDPNWGRIAAAVGYSGAEVDPDRLDITINGTVLCKSGTAIGDRADADLSGPQVTVRIDLGLGEFDDFILTTDLSHAYVEENSAYSS